MNKITNLKWYNKLYTTLLTWTIALANVPLIFFAWTNYHSSVKSLKEVLPLLKQSVSTKPYTLVLMDCQMPVMDGYEVSAAIGEAKAGESLKDIPIVTMRA